jgi:transcription antitermination factor NusG
VEKLYPSEDGEALRRNGHTSVRSERNSALDGLFASQAASNWFALYTTPRHEKQVSRHLEQRQIEFYLPLYRSERKWRDGSRVSLDLPLFPSYLFVHIQRSERVRVLEVPGALAVVGGTGGEPAALPDATIEALRSGLERRHAEPHPLLTVGQRVRIQSGALAGLEGVVMRKKNSFRVVLTLEHIMKSIAVEVDGTDLEPISSGDVGCAEFFQL